MSWLEDAVRDANRRLADQQVTTADLIAVKTSVLCEVARELERLRRTNPMNGDASNLMLDQCLMKVFKLDGSGLSTHAAADEREAMAKKAEADYLRLEEQNRVRRNRDAKG